MTLEEALARLAESRRALRQAIEDLSEEEMTQVQVEGVWTVKDVLGHITSWEEVLLEPLRRYAEGGPFVAEVIQDDLAWNDEQAARKREVPLAAILEELAAIRRELVETAGRLSAGQRAEKLLFPWGEKGTVAQGLGVVGQHEMEHVEHIQGKR